jgi:hypothetical protein
MNAVEIEAAVSELLAALPRPFAINTIHKYQPAAALTCRWGKAEQTALRAEIRRIRGRAQSKDGYKSKPDTRHMEMTQSVSISRILADISGLIGVWNPKGTRSVVHFPQRRHPRGLLTYAAALKGRA